MSNAPMNVWIAMRYTSTVPVRLALALAATWWAILFSFAPVYLLDDPVYSFMLQRAPATSWGALFAIDAVLLYWRIFESRARVGMSRVILSATGGLWTIYIACAYQALGYFAPDIADAFVMLLCAAWCALRTDLNVNDRESA